ncbi:protein kinase domain-containing protein [Cylindrospermopsis raciborskii]|uniref:protein kinase domain-containing protein n=1 Tax=Cylindrospermopsis raciborskii TaxID=77022 RepID=UPI0038795F74
MMNTVAVGQKITTQDKEYEIIDPCPLGRGAFGITFKAIELTTKQICVIKQFRPLSTETWEKGLELFNREAEKLSELQHNQIPRLVEYFNRDGEYYLIQEYIDGHDLTEEITKNIKEEKYVTRLLEDILEVLSFIHDRGLIHRDLKPSNIRRRKSDQKIVLIDFGSVKETISQTEIENNNLQPGTRVYTRGYSPMEQKMEGKSYLSSDIYAVGVIAIQALTGQPFDSPIFDHPSTDNNLGVGNQLNDTLYWHRYAPSVSKPLADIIDKMVMRKHKSRYQSAQEALEAIRSMSSQSFLPPSGRAIDKESTIVEKGNGKRIKPIKSRILVISGIGLSVIAAILIGDIVKESETLNKEYAENNIRIAYSDKWVYTTESFDTHLVKFIPKQTGSNGCITNMTIARDELATLLSVQEYKQKAREKIKNNHNAKIVIKDETKGHTLLAKKSAYKLSYPRRENQCEFQVLETGTVHGGQGYYISYNGVKGEYGKYLPTIEAMIDTFKIEE